MYLQLIIESNKEITNLDKKKYIDKLYGDNYSVHSGNSNIGFISKFNNAIGFKGLNDEITDSVVTRALIKSPCDYKTPSSLLFDSIQSSVKGNEICVFTVENKKIIHTDTKYSYLSSDILVKFKHFLEKVFSEVSITIVKKDFVEKQNELDFIKEWFFRSIATEFNYEVEASITREFNEEELCELVTLLMSVRTDISIRQGYCEVCKGYNENTPYHIEVVYEK